MFITELFESKTLDPDLYGEMLPTATVKRIVASVINQVDPDAQVTVKQTPEGYYSVNSEKIRLDFGITADGGDINANIVNAYSSYKGKNVVTEIFGQCFRAAEKLWGKPAKFVMSAHEDRGHGVWQHIAQKLGAEWQGSISEISDEALQRYLQGAGKHVDRRLDRMARVRDRLNKGYEIYHADRPANGSAIVDRFEADTPALARQYYERFITRYESDVDFDLQLRRATGIMESYLNEASSDEAWELVGQPVPEIQQFVKQMGYSNDEQSVAKITPIIDSATATQIPAASIPKLKNLANKGNDVQTLKAIQQISGRPDAAQQYTRLMQARDAGEGRNRGYPVGDLIQAVKSGNYDAPVLLKLPTGTYVVGGRTRLYAALALGIPAKVKIISVNNFKQGVAETVNPMRQQAGRMIDKYFSKIYEYGDSGLDYLDNHAPTWFDLFNQYNGDIDVIIATAPVNLMVKAAQELKNVASDLGYELSEAAGQQYLWHGSTQEIPVLTPRQAQDTGGASGSNQNAIYATSDPKVAIAMGLTERGSDTGMFPNDPQMVLFSGKIRRGQNVYLHKLPFNGPNGKPQFVQGGNTREFHSAPGIQAIKPVEIKAVPVDKYLNLIRTATPQDLELRKKYMAEAFDQPYKATWEKSDYGDYDALVTLPDGKPLSIMFNHEGDGEYQVEFYRNHSQEVTGEGDAQRIFATVLSAIQKFIKKQHPERIRFSATKDDDDNNQSRTKLYDRLVQRYAAAWGYSVDVSEYAGSTVYELSNDLNEVTMVPTVAKSKRQHLDVMPNDGQPIPPGQESEYMGDLVADMGNGLELWSWSDRGTVTYYVFDTATRTSQLGTTGRPYKTNRDSFVIQGVYSGPRNQYRAADLYAFLILNQGLTLVSDNKQSEGGYRVWQELERRYKNINVHGFDTRTDAGVNVTTQDEPDTHVSRADVKRAGPQMKRELGSISRDLRFVASAK